MDVIGRLPSQGLISFPLKKKNHKNDGLIFAMTRLYIVILLCVNRYICGNK